MIGNIESISASGNGLVPNSCFPSLIYRGVVEERGPELENLLRRNSWVPSWRNNVGMYPKHHFHSEAHELIVIMRGSIDCQIGGHDGPRLTLDQNDAIVIPAGVAHLGLSVTDDLYVVGAFPSGFGFVDFRLCFEEEYPELAARCREVPVPHTDPFHGVSGPLPSLWTAQAMSSHEIRR